MTDLISKITNAYPCVYDMSGNEANGHVHFFCTSACRERWFNSRTEGGEFEIGDDANWIETTQCESCGAELKRAD